jgi:tetratricopeptide (TPR) repeat protein
MGGGVAHDPIGSPVAEFCAGLRQLLKDSGRDAAALRLRVNLQKSQLYDTLNGKKKRPPDWATFVRPLVEFCTNGDANAVAQWRRRHEVLLQVDEQVRRRDRLARRAGLSRSPDVSSVTLRQAQALPPSSNLFRGRRSELQRLAEVARGPRTATGICVIEGMPGVGKTSLALQAAHLTSSRYADAQLFLDLQGHAADLEPLTSLEALGSLLSSLGAPQHAIPDDLEGRAAYYRSLLAGTRTLILLDNAATTDQVRPLLPGSAKCLVIVTSRHNLSGLDSTQVIALDVMETRDATDAFRAIVGLDRVSADDPAVGELLEYCGYLPIAISIVAARLNRRRALQPADIAEQLRDEYNRLGQLKDSDRNLAAVFDMSYRHLPGAQQELFRLLGLHPGPDFSIYAAANLADIDPSEAERLLESLLDHHLLMQQTPGRYRFHDLARAYARTLKSPEDDSSLAAGPDPSRSSAAVSEPLGRLLSYYLSTALAADRHFERRLPAIYEPRAAAPIRPCPAFDLPEQALGWVSMELLNLRAAIRYAATTHHHVHYAIALPASIAQYLRDQGLWDLASELHGLAVKAAEQLDETLGQAGALVNLAIIQRLTTAFTPAAAGLAQALQVYTSLGHRLGQAGALAELAIVQRLTGKYAEAEAALVKALMLYEDLEEPHGQAGVLAELGVVYQQRGSFIPAIDTLTKALGQYHQLGNRSGEAGTLAYLGSVKVRIQDYPSAENTLSRALKLYRELGDRNGQANTLLFLGAVYGETDNQQLAEESYLAALQLYRELGERRGEAGVLVYLGALHIANQEYDDARTCLADGLHRFREVNDAGGEVETLLHLAMLAARTQTPEEARQLYFEALLLARRITSGKDEADALSGLAMTYKAEGQSEKSATYAQQAIERYESLGLWSNAEQARAALIDPHGG